jgi:hypothetical protein
MPPAERRMLAFVMLALPLFHVTASRLSGLARLAPREPLPPERLSALIAAVGAKLPVMPSCLVRSRFLCLLLEARGTRAQLRIGVRIDDSRLSAHAWVESDGRPVNDSADVALRYPPFAQPIPLAAFDE